MTDMKSRFALPVDPELYLWCHGVYSAAADLTMPVENPGARPAVEYDDKVYSFSDIPVNRGMLAITKEMREMGTPDDIRMALMTRMMQFGDVFGQPETEPFIKKGGSPDEVQVSEALIKACATAQITVTEEKISFDLADVARIAQELTDAEEAEEAGQ